MLVISIIFLNLFINISLSQELFLEKLYELPHIQNQLKSKIINIHNEIYYINENLDFIIFKNNSVEKVDLSMFKTYWCDNIANMFYDNKNNLLYIYSGLQGYNNFIIYDIKSKKTDSIYVPLANNYAKIFYFNEEIYIASNYINGFSIGKINLQKKKYENILYKDSNTIKDFILLDSNMYLSLQEVRIVDNNLISYNKLIKFNLFNSNYKQLENSEYEQKYKMIKLPNNNFCIISRITNYNGLIIRYYDVNFSLIYENKIDSLLYINDYIVINDNIYLLNYDKKLVVYNYKLNDVKTYSLNVTCFYLSNLYDDLVFVANDDYIYKLDISQLGIQSNKTTKFSISPNPANNTLYIKSLEKGENEIEVYNSELVLVHKETTNKTELLINTTSLSSGAYFIKIKNGNNIINDNFIIKK